MNERYKAIYTGGEGEIIDKKSRFIASLCPVETESEALAFIEQKKKQHYNAAHNCYAFVIGDNQELKRCSDDGEPSQTAGAPMLGVLLGEDIHNICVVVTRYFGGTLLGTGGLVRAYTNSVSEGLKHCTMVEKYLAKELAISTDYTSAGKVQYILGQLQVTLLKSDYTENVVFTILVPISQLKDLISKITECTNGKADIEEILQVYYGIVDKKVIVFDNSVHF